MNLFVSSDVLATKTAQRINRFAPRATSMVRFKKATLQKISSAFCMLAVLTGSSQAAMHIFIGAGATATGFTDTVRLVSSSADNSRGSPCT